MPGMASKPKSPQLEVNNHLDNRTESNNGRTRTKNYKLRDLSRHFTKPTTALDLDVSFCSRCRVLDLATVFASADAGDDLSATVIADIGSLNHATINSSCQLCSFLLCLTYNRSPFRVPDDNWKLCTFDSLTIRGFRETLKTITEPRSMVICPLPCYYESIDDLTMHAVVVSVDHASTQRLSRFCYRVRQLYATSINYDLIKNWLQDCEGRHKRCRLETPMHRPTKVIDSLQRKIILITPDTKYFALSYVWGALMGNIVAPKLSPGDEHLPEDIPRLIADAMTLVVSLGSKHLWVDRWCIDQGNKEETPQQVSCMDDIYEGAIATIIAVTSAAPDKRMSGVSVPRITPPDVRISGDVYLQGLYSVSYQLYTSEWNRRGWTYQEFRLSRCCILLAEYQVHLFCKTGKTCEEIEEAALSDQPFRFHRCLIPDILNQPTDYASLCAIPNASVRLRIEINPRRTAAPPCWIQSHGLTRFPSL